MRKLNLAFCLLFCGLSVVSFAQQSAETATPSTLKFSLYEPEDSIGRIVFETLDAFEKYGHFGPMESQQKSSSYITNFAALFDSTAMISNDLSGEIISAQPIPIKEYDGLARKKGYRKYVLFIEKTDTTVAEKIDSSNYYYMSVRIFMLYSDRAIIGDSCDRGAIFNLSLKINGSEREVKITDVELAENGKFTNFYLGNYGRHSYSPILVSNNVKSLAIPIPPPYQPTSKPTKSNIFLHAGYILTNYLQPEAMRNNLNANYAFSGSESGRSAGIKYQKVYGKRNMFGLFFGVEYEENIYDFEHTNANFIYTEDEQGNGLTDLEGTPYDRKYVQVASYEENGMMKYIKPEVGLLLNFGKRVLNFQVLGSVGNAFLMSSTYDATATVSYQGQIDGLGDPISQDALGFYTDRQSQFSADHNQVQNYMFYKFGAGLDIIMGQRVGLSFLLEYRSAFTYAVRKNTTGLMFLDPDTDGGYYSQLNTLDASRTYNGLSLQVGLKFYLNELR